MKTCLLLSALLYKSGEYGTFYISGDDVRKGAIFFWIFVSGGVIYSLLEILWRGYTHWTMALTGGLCLLMLYWMDGMMGNVPFLLRCLIGAILITAVEFCVGIVVNLMLGMEVWDYSERWGNVLGQICPVFTGMWFVLCIPALLLTRFLSGILEQHTEETSEAISETVK